MAENTISYSYQFEVFDQGDQVYKQLLTVEQSEARFGTYGRKFLPTIHGIAKAAVTHAAENTARIRDLLEEYPEVGPTLANPVIEPNGSYVQDKVTVFGDALKKASRKEQRSLIDQYVDLSLRHVSYGFMERIFKVTANCGVDDNDNVVLIDIGELAFDRDEAVETVASKKWLRQEAFVYPFPRPRNFALPNIIKPYFAKRMSLYFSADIVAQTWAQSIR